MTEKVNQINSPLDEHTTPATALTQLIQRNLALARRNEAGILADQDIEFLHDYRVGIRRIRAALVVFRSHFNSSILPALKQNFSQLMAPTGQLRDLDVALSEPSVFNDRLPNAERDNFLPFFTYLAVRRQIAYKELRKYLESQQYQAKLQQVNQLTAQLCELESSASSTLTCQQLVKSTVAYEFEKATKKAAKIGEADCDKNLHQLRILCKKLRYSLELFSPLLPTKPRHQLVKRLKVLQDEMGEYNDNCMQLEMICDFEAQKECGQNTRKTVKLLIQNIKQTQLSKRQEIEQFSDEFFNAETMALIQSLVK